ncbi:MAG: DNA topoisomerase, partial [Myxococcales bacterium]|nr:DNA topoisomerase [Myxococcales bacterium]
DKLVSKRLIQGPDFPTGGELLNDRESLVEIYTNGVGAFEVRGTYTVETEGKREQLVIGSIPFGLNKATLIEDIAGHVRQGKLPQLVDVRDESTDEIRIVLELKKGADAEAAMAYLFKKTALQSRFSLNMTVLVPTDDPALTVPRRLGLKEVLEQFLAFRSQVVRRRLEYDLRRLEERIHILRGFAIVFNALDEAIRLIRESDGKADARDRLMRRFELDYDQAEAILETKLYRLAKLEIDDILAELAAKEAEAAGIREILADDVKLWAIVRSELTAIRDAYGDARRTRVTGPIEEVQFSAEVYIVAEDGFVIVTRQGWVKRQKSYTEVGAIRVREGDEVGWIVAMSTREALVVFTDQGRAYTVRGQDIMMTTGYGEPIQTKFDFADGERIVGVATSDDRTLPLITEDRLAALSPEDPMPPYVVALTRGGKAVRVSVHAFTEPSNRNGRLYVRLDKDFAGDAVTNAFVSRGDEVVSLATRQGRCALFPVEEVNVLSGAGKGVLAVKLPANDHVLGFMLTRHRMDGLPVVTSRGRDEVIRPNKFSVTARGGRGREVIRHGTLALAPQPAQELRFRDGAAGADEPSPLTTPPDDGQGTLL